jgi:hypothetical protein
VQFAVHHAYCPICPQLDEHVPRSELCESTREVIGVRIAHSDGGFIRGGEADVGVLGQPAEFLGGLLRIPKRAAEIEVD